MAIFVIQAKFSVSSVYVESARAEVVSSEFICVRTRLSFIILSGEELKRVLLGAFRIRALARFGATPLDGGPAPGRRSQDTEDASPWPQIMSGDPGRRVMCTNGEHSETGA